LYHKKLAQDRQGGEIPLHVVERPLDRTLGAEGEDYESGLTQRVLKP
jgi:hypothetical protein